MPALPGWAGLTSGQCSSATIVEGSSNTAERMLDVPAHGQARYEFPPRGRPDRIGDRNLDQVVVQRQPACPEMHQRFEARERTVLRKRVCEASQGCYRPAGVIHAAQTGLEAVS